MNEKSIIELEKTVEKGYSNIVGISVLHEGKLQYEKYFNGCNQDSKVHVYSVSKSVISLLFGIALNQGYIQDINQRVINFSPDYRILNNEKVVQNITLEDMLMMTVPYKYKFPPLTYMRYFMSKDWEKFTLNYLGGKGKIGDFNYTPLVGPDIFSAILMKATKQTVFDFAQENLFKPLEINIEKNIILNTVKEQTTFNKATNISGWVCDTKGLNTGGWGLTLSVSDMAKIGQLILNKGMWQDRRIVSSQWIEDSTTKHSHWDKVDLSYGYLWWILDPEQGIYAAMGDGGNIIYINQDKKLVVSIASLSANKVKDRVELIKKYIEPFV
ncbi:serine hydrolase [Lactobacillus sp. YT155]|uniref:serine hydrolase domain-containing protein n=1 Tax=Lactobacillus sp. YT155 TaxID=3060955 RepID=UPI0026600CB9|nr:serine hydrolase [Lactobacillus sp. YT155]MDO1604718.1 serine hydrolase [Lactobacillus sp. YT155]